jgi:tripartite-type tricarboxylate transporter receptor subunit TctC
MKFLHAGCVVALLAWSSHARPALAFPDRNLEMIIPSAAGGGFDAYSRAVARALDRHLPNGVRTIPKNVPGAGTRTAMTQLYHASPDGYTFGMVSLPVAVEPHVLGQKVNYDLDKVTWLGAIDTGIYALLVSGKSNYRTFQSVRDSAKPLFLATTAGTDLTSAKIVSEALRTKFNYLTGYKGAPEAILAVSRGEADAIMGILNIVAKRIENGELRPLLVLQRKRANMPFPELPNADSVGRPELASLGLYRPFAAPPNLPEGVQTRLTELIQKALNDSELADWSQKTGNQIQPETAAETIAHYREIRKFLGGYKHLLGGAR